VVPGIGIGGLGFFGLRQQQWSLNADVRGDLGPSVEVKGGEVSATRVAGGLAPCVHEGVLLVCGLGRVGVLYASGSEVTYPRQANATFAVAGARIGLELPLTNAIDVHGCAEVVAPLRRVRLELDGDEVWKSPPLSAWLGAGIGTTIP